MNTATIARNARKHYAMRGGVPVWNPSLAKYFILSLVGGAPKFRSPSVHDYNRIARASRKGEKSIPSLYRGMKFVAHAPGFMLN